MTHQMTPEEVKGRVNELKAQIERSKHHRENGGVFMCRSHDAFPLSGKKLPDDLCLATNLGLTQDELNEAVEACYNVAKSLGVKKATQNETWGPRAMLWVWVSPFPDPPRVGFSVKAQLEAHYGAGCLKHAEISSRTTRAGKALAEKKRTAQGARKTRTASRASDSAASASVAAAAATTTESRTPAAAKVKESSDKDPLVRVLLFLTVCRCFV